MAKKTKAPVTIEQIDGMIHTIRGVRVMLDRDLAKIYGVPTFRFNEAIKRNRHRFPGDFAFQLTAKKFASLRSQAATTNPQTAGNLGDYELIADCDEFQESPRCDLPPVGLY